MTFFPADYDPRDPVAAVLDLCEIDTPDGAARFILGTDGKFTDANGNTWMGSQLLNVGSLESAIGGQAPEGEITLSYFQDPDADNLIAELRATGVDYIAGRPIKFLIQPSGSMAEFQAPTVAPIQWLERTMRVLSFSASGALDRSISVSFEAWSEDRQGALRIVLNTEGHAQLTGSANPSLEFMPTDNFQEEKLFG